MLTNKFIVVYTLLLTSATLPTDLNSKKAYVAGFEDGGEAYSNAYNAQMCANHYRNQGATKPGPECYEHYENYKLRLLRYEKIKKEVEKANETTKKDGKSSERDKKNSD